MTTDSYRYTSFGTDDGVLDSDIVSVTVVTVVLDGT